MSEKLYSIHSKKLSVTYHNIVGNTINYQLQFSWLYFPLFLDLPWENNTLSTLKPNIKVLVITFMGPTLYVEGFQRMGDLQQQSVRAEGQVQGHVPGYWRLRSGQKEVDIGFPGDPGASLKHRETALDVWSHNVSSQTALRPCCSQWAQD